ncbi:hypothetical protein [Fusobacterium sp. PH5-44]|uniref:hypothetical protein n=1 Tax=Fusobacterium sp. PH5-44 TaxID=2940518 RepID=UPI003D203641
MKTTTLVPQVAKGVYQGINNPKYNVFGQLANNLGKNGFDIVAYAYGVDKELKNLINDYINGNGELVIDEETMDKISGLLKPLLAEYGKDFYSIQFIEDEKIKSGMSVDDTKGKVFINLHGNGFGDSTSMLEELGHEGMHGTYADKDIDESAASSLTNFNKIKEGSIGFHISTEVAAGRIIISTKDYNDSRANDDLRDVAIGMSYNGSFPAFLLRVNGGQTCYIIVDTENKKGYRVAYKDIGIGVSSPDVGITISALVLPTVNSPKELGGTNSRNWGLSIFEYGIESINEGVGLGAGHYSGYKFGVGVSALDANIYYSIDNVFMSPSYLEEFTPTDDILDIAKEIEEKSKPGLVTSMKNTIELIDLMIKLQKEVKSLRTFQTVIVREPDMSNKNIQKHLIK